MVKRIRIDMSDKLFYMFIVAGLTILSVAVVYGYGTSNPVAFGHSIGEIAPPANCSGGQVLGWSGSDWECVTVVPGAGEFDLIYGAHSGEQCTNLAGTVVDIGTGEICKFSSSSCPAGWAQYLRWSTTTSNSADCNAHYDYRGENDQCVGRPYEGPICYTGGHAFSDTTRESCTSTYDAYTGYSNHCSPSCTGPNYVTAYAHITEMGCY